MLNNILYLLIILLKSKNIYLATKKPNKPYLCYTNETNLTFKHDMRETETKVLPVLEMSCAVCAGNVESTVQA